MVIFPPPEGAHAFSMTMESGACCKAGFCRSKLLDWVKAVAAAKAESLSGRSESVPMNLGIYSANSGCAKEDS